MHFKSWFRNESVLSYLSGISGSDADSKKQASLQQCKLFLLCLNLMVVDKMHIDKKYILHTYI